MFYSQEQWDEAQAEEHTQAMIHDYGGWIPAAHAQWHQIHGREAACPLDCAPDGWDPDPYDWEDGNVICGHCKARDRSVEHVRLCPSR